MSVINEIGCDALHLYLDGELDTVESLGFEKHLETCAQCRQDLADFRAIRAEIQTQLTRSGASDGLRRRISAAIAQEEAPASAPASRRRPVWEWPKLAAAAVVLVILSSSATFYLNQPSEESQWTAAVLAAHQRAMLSGHEIDVVSSNRHTVKPWFSGKTNVAPLVADLGDTGFPLIGGRLDVPLHEAMPAIIYGAGPHVISLYMRPASGEAAPALKKIDGFSVLSWRGNGFAFTAVSDADGSEITAFQKAYAAKAATMP